MNRELIENNFMGLLVNKPELIPLLQIRPRYLQQRKNQKLLKQMIDCYKENKTVTAEAIYERDKSIDFDWYATLLTEVSFQPSNWKKQFETSEKSILNFYKKDVIKANTKEFEIGKINYDEYMKQMKRVDEVQLGFETKPLTVKEIKANITDKQIIEFKSFSSLSKTLKMVYGDFLIVGATTGTGKSSFMLNLMIDLMEDYQCIYFNMEMSKNTIYKRLISIKANVPIYKINNEDSEYQKSLIDKAIYDLEKANVIIEHQANDIEKIRSVVAMKKILNKHTIVFIDHLGLTRTKSNKGLYEQTTEVAKELRQMCLEYDCTIIAASQLNRTAYTSERYSISMLKDSGEIENSASKIILLSKNKEQHSKDDLEEEMDIEIAKNRDGMLGFISMTYDKRKQIFKERLEMY